MVKIDEKKQIETVGWITFIYLFFSNGTWNKMVSRVHDSLVELHGTIKYLKEQETPPVWMQEAYWPRRIKYPRYPLQLGYPLSWPGQGVPPGWDTTALTWGDTPGHPHLGYPLPVLTWLGGTPSVTWLGYPPWLDLVGVPPLLDLARYPLFLHPIHYKK